MSVALLDASIGTNTGPNDLLYLGLEADCDVTPWYHWPPSVLLWRATGRRCVSRRGFVTAYLHACFAQGDGNGYIVDGAFVDAWHDNEITCSRGVLHDSAVERDA